MDKNFTELVACIVEASYRPELWPSVCDRLIEQVGATAFMIFEYDFEKFGSQIFHSSADFSVHGRDVIEVTKSPHLIPEEEMEGYTRFARKPAGSFYSEFELYDLQHDEFLPVNPFRDRVLAAGKSRSRTVAKLNYVGPWADVGALHMPQYGVEISPDVRSFVNELIPILANSLESGRILRGLAESYSALLNAFDVLDFAVSLCRADGGILVANRTFEEMAAERDALSNNGGTVASVFPGETDDLRNIVRSALDLRARPEDLITSLHRRSGRLPLVAKAAPVRDVEVDRATLALLVVIDPEDQRRLNASGLEAFDLLSPAELDVCEHIIRGTATEDIAKLRSTSLHTTRGQIKSSSAKLACKSRLDLVRLALSTRPPVRK